MTDPVVIHVSRTGLKPYSVEGSGFAFETFTSAVQGTLLKQSVCFTFHPGHVEDWTWDEKNLSYTLRLNPNIYFHNGRNATALDLEFSLLRWLFTEKDPGIGPVLYSIKGADPFFKGQQFESGKVTGVRVKSKYEVCIDLKKTDLSFLSALTSAYFSLVPLEELEDDYVTWKALPIGAGPFKVISSDANSSLVKLESAESPHRFINFVTDNSVKNADLIDGDFATEDMSLEMLLLPRSLRFFMFNLKSELGSNYNFKKAVAFALNREEIFQRCHYLIPNYSLLTGSISCGDSTYIELQYNPERAKSLLATIPQELVAQHYEIPFTGYFSENSKLVFSLMEAQLKAVGLNFTFKFSQSRTLIAEDTMTPLIFTGFCFDTSLDPLHLFHNLKDQGQFKNEIPEKDVRLESLYSNIVEKKGTPYYSQAISDYAKHIIDRGIVIPLFEEQTTYTFNPKKIESLGLQLGGASLILDKIKFVV